MRVSDFHFDLPQELIAQHPPEVRGSSRMLVLNRAVSDPSPSLTDDLFANLPNYLQPGDLLILNDSRVLPARLFATRAGAQTQANSPRPAGRIEVLLTERIESQESNPTENVWRVLVKPARKVQPGETLSFWDTSFWNTSDEPVATSTHPSPPTPPLPIPTDELSFRPERAARSGETRNSTDPEPPQPILTAEILSAGEFGERTIRFSPTPDFYDRITRIGHMPLPPYIRRDQSAQQSLTEDNEDKSRYQTVYSNHSGSAAAPTAGLHFTPEILAALTARGVEIAYLTLHVGLGTFQPVRVSTMEEIRLHSERYTLPATTAKALNRALSEGRRVIAVGTTTTRTLEHIAAQAAIPTELSSRPERAARSGETRNLPAHPPIEPHSGSTSIFLSPGHNFRIVSGLLTNFHLPESTLLMLVAAFAGEGLPPSHSADQGRQTILAAYAHAIHHRYRFYSYGDCMLLL